MGFLEDDLDEGLRKQRNQSTVCPTCGGLPSDQRFVRTGQCSAGSVEGFTCTDEFHKGFRYEDRVKSKKQSVIQDWAQELPLRFQGTLLTAVRGCDVAAKQWTRTGVAYSPERRLTAFIRCCFMNPADAREIDAEEGAFFMSTPPDNFKPSEFGHMPEHYYAHAMHALEIIGYYHPNDFKRVAAHTCYLKMVHNMHLNPESKEQQWKRLTEDRIAKGEVVS